MDALESLTSPVLVAPFELPRLSVPAFAEALCQPVRRALERTLGLTELNALYRRTRTRPEAHFADRALAVLDVSMSIRGSLDSISESGPLLVVANHPFGALDGLVLASLVARRRADAKLLANHVLAWLPDLRRDLFLVDPFGGRHAAARNRQPLRAAVRWVRNGGCLCVFPSGVVSHYQLRRGLVADPDWHDSIGRLVQLTGARTVPCHIEGRNSLAFQAAGLVHPALRTLLLPRELLRRRGTRVIVRIGAPIEAGESDGDAARLTASLRAHVDGLSGERSQLAVPVVASSVTSGVAASGVPLTFDARGALVREITPLIAAQALARSDAFVAFWATSSQAPGLLQEIGRLRERTFRAAGEGTGREIDLDAFDARYRHLCVWDERAGRLVGAYRLHEVPTSPPSAAVGPLYTQTLFRYDQALVDAIAPAIELGRAFVVPEYQKQYAPLMLLWTGIGRYVARQARVRHLFGAVSIASTYSPAAREVMLAWLARHAGAARLAGLVSPRRPVCSAQPIASAEAAATARSSEPADLASLNDVVARLDEEGKGLPVLLRQYLKLNARVVSFSVDPSFGHVIDALMVVDLWSVPEVMLRKYMGRDEARGYLAHHTDFAGPRA